MTGKLYVVGTPIGNLGDLSPRAAQTLREADFIAAEDTRVSVKLLNHLSVKKPMVCYHAHNMRERSDEILARIQQGEICALVSDAGMPAISDPGEILVRLCRQADVPVEAVPGPSACITALAVSGMPAGRFCFEGFLSVNKNNRKERLAQLAQETRTIIFYEAPHKLYKTLRDLYECLGEREVALCRELTKRYEQVERTTLSAACEQYRQAEPKGEFVLIVQGAQEPERALPAARAAAFARQLLEAGLSASEAARLAASVSDCGKSEIYKRLVGQSPAE